MIDPINPISPTGIGNILITKDSDRIPFPKAEGCFFLDASKPLEIPLPKILTSALPVNGKRAVEYNHKRYLLGFSKGVYRDSKLVAKGWIALFKITAKPETVASVVMIKGETSDFIFENGKDLNDFLFDVARQIAAAPPMKAPQQPLVNPLNPVPNYYGGNIPNFYVPPTPNNVSIPFGKSGSLLH